MAETTKSVLFFDYDSIHRSLTAAKPEAAAQIAVRVAAWIAAIEAGKIFAARPDPARRRILVRRCYADPALLGDTRSHLLSNGFQVIDCPPGENRERNAAAIHMVLDTIDALEHPAGYEEFVLLSADADLSPLLIRLRAHNRLTAIYANPVTSESYRAIADAMIDEAGLVSVLLAEEEEEVEDRVAPEPTVDRAEVEALARKISAVTNVPLFAPRTFAELFRYLVEEIADNGYHFQNTAENVAARMTAAGRNVTRRQVVFVVKGLALKGHVFSTGDTPERLAEVFSEQVAYLSENAGLALDEHERSVLLAWIVGYAPSAATGSSQETEIPPAAASPGDATKETPTRPSAKPAQDQPGRSSRKRPTKAAPAGKVEAAPAKAPAPDSEPQKPAVEAAKATLATAPAKAVEPAKPPAAEASLVEKSAQVPTKPAPIVLKSPAGAGKPAAVAVAPATRPLTATARSSASVPPRTVQRPRVSDADKAAVESSILAAIAQAVDVLVEDGGGKKPKAPLRAQAELTANGGSPPPDTAEAAAEDDDIGDEIQRIIASYNRNRSEDGLP